MTVVQIVADVISRLERLGIPYAVGGSLASSVWGEMRTTNDADIAIRLAPGETGSLLAAFGAPYYISQDELREAMADVRDFRSVQLLHMDEAFKIDLFLLGDSPYDTSELRRARRVETLPGVTVCFSAPEDIVIVKLRWYVLGNRVSDRQWNDVVRILEEQKTRIDDAYLDEWAAQFGLTGLLLEARSQTFM